MNFIKNLLASLLGTVLGILFLFLILLIVVSSSSSEPEPYVRSNTVLEINLGSVIPARVTTNPIDEIFQQGKTVVSLENLKANLEKAASDERISGVWLKSNFMFESWANLETALGYLKNYKKSGKFLYYSTDDIGMNEKAYFLASAADSIFAPPQTSFEFNGFFAQPAFLKGTLEKLGIEPEIIRVGKYKSAIEPFIQKENSPESEEQLAAILNQATQRFIEAVQEKTGKGNDEINALLGNAPTYLIEDAFENGLVDVLAYPDEVVDVIKNRMNVEEDDDLKTISYSRYNRVENSSAGLEQEDTDNKIAVMYLSGAILPELDDGPFGDQSGITSQSIQKNLEEIREDENVKAVVVHIDSPGGAATTSDLIWNYFKKTEIPVVAVMGSVAASGGYYIAAGADTIVADPNTVTGSIGVFRTMFNTQDLYNEKLGITFDEVKTHGHADMLTMTRPLTDAEKESLQRATDATYETFLNRVAESRGITRDQVHDIAQGRVWTGADAHERNLVDILGNLETGLATAAAMAGIETYKTDVYPRKKDFFQEFLGSASTSVKTWMMGWIPFYEDITALEQINAYPNIHHWAYLPVRFTIQ